MILDVVFLPLKAKISLLISSSVHCPQKLSVGDGTSPRCERLGARCFLSQAHDQSDGVVGLIGLKGNCAIADAGKDLQQLRFGKATSQHLQPFLRWQILPALLPRVSPSCTRGETRGHPEKELAVVCSRWVQQLGSKKRKAINDG